MKANKVQIFQQGSRTYYYSSFFFPKKVFEDVATLYAFVRIADNYVDQVPQDKDGLFSFKTAFEQAWHSGKSANPVINEFIQLAKLKEFKREWINAFLQAMEADLIKNDYATMDELIEYMHGSAEVIGLMMNRIMGVDPKYDEQAKMLGRGMQYINFLRDLAEDQDLGRRYIPQSEMKAFGIQSLQKDDLQTEITKQQFINFYREQIKQYQEWNTIGRSGLKGIPYRMRVPISTASNLYSWTAKQIEKNPLIVFEKKVKPSKYKVILTGLASFITMLFV